jgi:hypothetical protein
MLVKIDTHIKLIKENQRKKYLVRLHLYCFFIFKNKFQLYKT